MLYTKYYSSDEIGERLRYVWGGGKEKCLGGWGGKRDGKTSIVRPTCRWQQHVINVDLKEHDGSS